MSTVVYIRALMDAGLSASDALKAAEVYETMQPTRSKGAERTRRWRERHAASQGATCDGGDACDDATVTEETPSLSPSPQTPQPHTHPRDETTRAREGAASAVVIALPKPAAADDWPEGDCRRHADLLAAEANTHRLDPSKAEGLLLTSARLAAWRAAGASWQFDVVPTVTALAGRAGRKITSWKFFDDAIAQSIADNRAALSIPEANPHAGQAHDRISASQSARRENRDRASAGADWASEVMASRRAL